MTLNDGDSDPDWVTAFQSPQKLVNEPQTLSSSSDVSIEKRGDAEEANAGEVEKGVNAEDKEEAAVGTKRTSPLKKKASPAKSKVKHDDIDGAANEPGREDAETADAAGGGTAEKRGKQRASSSMPVMLPERISVSKALVECDADGTALDLSGDVGAVGRLSVVRKVGTTQTDLFLDLKGIIYKAAIVPTCSFLVVNVGQAEAKVEAVINDCLLLQEERDMKGDETLVEGNLGGWAEDSDEEPQRGTGTGEQSKKSGKDVGPTPGGRQVGSKSKRAPKGPGKKEPKARTGGLKGRGQTGVSRKPKAQKKAGKK